MTRSVGRRAEAAGIGILLLVLLCSAGCSTAKKKKLAAEYGPTESIIEVVAVLRRHVPDDTYRFPPARDFTGRNVYRSSLLRLENIENIHEVALRSGYMDEVMLFSKGRALERLRAYDLAAEHYAEARSRGGDLQDEARTSQYVCERIDEAVRIGISVPDPLTAIEQGNDPARQDAELVVAELEERVALLGLLLDEVRGTHYEHVVKEEIERADEIRAAYFVDMRYALQDGQLRATGELQRVMNRHPASKRRLQHLLDLAVFYDDLAHEYVDAVPPETLDFDPARFEELVEPATQLYQSVATQDGTAEKLEASRRLEAFLAFTIQVDSDRFTQ
jgi:hypothetical protein